MIWFAVFFALAVGSYLDGRRSLDVERRDRDYWRFYALRELEERGPRRKGHDAFPK